MFCKNCGRQIGSDAKFCGFCGTEVDFSETELLDEEEDTAILMPSDETFAERTSVKDYSYIAFYEKFASKKTRSWTTTMVVICFLSSATSIVPLALGQIISIVDVLFYGLMGFALLKTKKWVFTLIPTLYSGFFTVVALASSGAATGVVALVSGIMSTLALRKINAAFKNYEVTRVCPERDI